MKSNRFSSPCTRLLLAATGALIGVGGQLAWPQTSRATAAKTDAPHSNPQTQPSEHLKPIDSVAELDGSWSGEADGVKVELLFDSKHGPFSANWTVAYAVLLVRPAPQQAPTMEMRKGSALRPVVKDGRLELFLPAYLGKDPAIKRSSWNGKKPVGEIGRRADGAIRLRIIPAGYLDPGAAEYDLPSVQGMMLHRQDNGVD